MFKTSYDLGKNGNVRLTFNVIVKNDNNNSNFIKAIDYFEYNNSKYLKFNTNPYITLDISSTEKKQIEGYNPNLYININRYSRVEFINKLRKFINSFSINDLFFIKNKKLHVNRNVADENKLILRTPNKELCMISAVLQSPDNPEIEYEGVILMIRDTSNYCYMKYEEVEYLLYTLEHIDMDALALQLINAYLTFSYGNKLLNEKKEIKKIQLQRYILENKQSELNSKIQPKIEEPKTIPEV